MSVILEHQLEANNEDTIGVQICISSKDVFGTPSNTPPRTLGETILENIYSDTTQGDVVFTFNVPGEIPYTGKKSDATSNLNTAKDQVEVIQDLKELEEGHNQSPVKSAFQAKILGNIKAYKLILAQWPYFKAMFKGGFAESGPGEKRIHIRDTKMKAFELLLRFMSTGRLDQDLMPKIKYSDELEDEEDVAMEDLFLAADRYDVMDLREITLKPLLASLGPGNVLPFLFRTAYKFPELRKTVIQFVAKSAGSAIPRKEIRNTYKDHPDLLDIVMDLLDVYDGLYP